MLTTLSYLVALITVMTSISTSTVVNVVPTHSVNVVGGTPTQPGEFPWATAFLRVGTTSTAFCTGTLIHPRFVLTAAHCPVSIGMSLLIGASDLQVNPIQFESGKIVQTTAKKVTQHPLWVTDFTAGHDVSIVELTYPVHVMPAKLETTLVTETTPSPALFIGYGRIQESANDTSRYLQKIHPIIWPVCDCIMRDMSDSNTDGYLFFPQWTALSQFACTVPQLIGHRPCYGDSGGPLILTGPPGTLEETWTIRGVLSNGPGSCNAYASNYYSRVASQLSFIASVVGGHMANLSSSSSSWSAKLYVVPHTEIQKLNTHSLAEAAMLYCVGHGAALPMPIRFVAGVAISLSSGIPKSHIPIVCISSQVAVVKSVTKTVLSSISNDDTVAASQWAMKNGYVTGILNGQVELDGSLGIICFLSTPDVMVVTVLNTDLKLASHNNDVVSASFAWARTQGWAAGLLINGITTPKNTQPIMVIGSLFDWQYNYVNTIPTPAPQINNNACNHKDECALGMNVVVTTTAGTAFDDGWPTYPINYARRCWVIVSSDVKNFPWVDLQFLMVNIRTTDHVRVFAIKGYDVVKKTVVDKVPLLSLSGMVQHPSSFAARGELLYVTFESVGGSIGSAKGFTAWVMALGGRTLPPSPPPTIMNCACHTFKVRQTCSMHASCCTWQHQTCHARRKKRPG